MLLQNQKKYVALIVGDALKNKKHDFVEGIRENKYPTDVKKDYSNGFEAAANEMIMAVGKNDTIAFAHALKNFITMCNADSEMED